ncbi:MAG: hypothetical protein ABSA68_02595 [Xanthobacteraceae bacterium]|jgi:hypothetical protein
MAGKDTRHQPSLKTGRVENHPGFADPNPNSRDVEHASHVHHHGRPGGIQPQTGGQPKHATSAPVPIHGGFAVRHPSGGGGFVTGGGDLRSALASGAAGSNISDQLAPPPKVFAAPVAIVPGQRSRTTPGYTSGIHDALGKAVLAAAIHNGGPHEGRAVPAKEK